MKKHLLLSILILISISVGVGLAISVFGIDDAFHANPADASGVQNVDRVENNIEVSTQRETSITPEQQEQPINEVNLTPEVSTPSEPSSPEDILREFNLKAIQGLKSGWLHVREEKTFDTDEPNNGVLPNGQSIPNHQLNDIWYHLNEDGLVLELVYIMRNSDGQIAQAGINSDGTSWNSATKEISLWDQFRLDGLDGNFLKDLRRLKEIGNTITVEDMTLPNGGKGILFSIVGPPDKPIQLVNYIKPFIRGETRALFDASSGYLIQKEEIFFFEDGTQRISLSLTQMIQFESPTDEVLNYLSEKAKVVNP